MRMADLLYSSREILETIGERSLACGSRGQEIILDSVNIAKKNKPSMGALEPNLSDAMSHWSL